jgi:microcystin-dependent protein
MAADTDQFVAEIRMFPFNFAPAGWAFCDGQLLPISQNTALFSLLGTTYGGNGQSTFALPNLQGDAPMQHGQGSGLSQRFLGEQSGVESVTLLQSEMPVHAHALHGCDSDAGDPGNDPTGELPAKGYWDSGTAGGIVGAYSDSASGAVAMAPQALSLAGGSLPHNNMQPYLTLNFCIALQGIFPPRT